jgi:hypothetical protein
VNRRTAAALIRRSVGVVMTLPSGRLHCPNGECTYVL